MEQGGTEAERCDPLRAHSHVFAFFLAHQRQPPQKPRRKHEQRKSYLNRIKEHDERLTRESSPGPECLALLAADQWTNAFLSLFNPFHKRHIQESQTFPGHALHEKGLQRQIGVGTLVSSQERRALAVPLINRG